jgi:fructose/tagatose bisphosphate aldolase
VSIGNVHGVYRQPPDLDWARLEAIRTSTRHPLSLHGASGIPEGELRRAIRSGIAKVNFNTELRQAYLASTREMLPDVFSGARVAALHAAQTDAVGRVVDDKLAVLRGEAPT